MRLTQLGHGIVNALRSHWPGRRITAFGWGRPRLPTIVDPSDKRQVNEREGEKTKSPSDRRVVVRNKENPLHSELFAPRD